MDTPQTLRMQIKIPAAISTVYKALTTSSALETWLAESARVDLDANTFLFWGKYTPDNPTATSQHMTLLAHQPDRLLKFTWEVNGKSTTVSIKLRERDEQTTVLTLIQAEGTVLRHQESQFTLEDYWFLHLENLRRYLAGKSSEARVDFSQPMNGNIRHILDSDASPEEIYAVLTQPDLIEKWIASHASIELEPGGEYDLGWGVDGIKVVDFDDNRSLSISWQEGSDGDLTTVTWTLEASGGKTRITFTHSGFDDDHRNDGIWAGWMNFLNWIRSVAEYGSDWQPPYISLKDHPYASIYPKSMQEAEAEIALLDL